MVNRFYIYYFNNYFFASRLSDFKQVLGLKRSNHLFGCW